MLWHLGWVAAIGVCAILLVAAGGLSPGVELAALAVGGSAALIGAFFALDRHGAGDGPAIVVWALGVAAACLMSGGVAGPLAPWCLAPLGAAAILRKPQGLALGAVGALGAAAVAGLGGLLLSLPEPEPWTRPWLSLLALATVALGLSAGMVSFQGRFRAKLRAAAGAEARLLDIIDNQPQLLLALGDQGGVRALYGAAPDGLDITPLAAGDLTDLALEADRPLVSAALQTALAQGIAEVAFRPVDDPDGRLTLNIRRGDHGLMAVLRDDRSQREREVELERARLSAESQNAGKSRFLANMSHELRTPLNAIMGFSDIMRQRLFGPVSDRYAEYAELIHESGSHLLELINDVLDMSKIEAERFELAKESFDAREAVSAVLRLMRGQADRAQINLRGELPREPLEAEADRRAIKQIVLNLISNALKFTPKGGSVTVSVRGEDDCLVMVVRDTGVGIPPQDLDRLGRPFEQAGDAGQRAAGAGLGLSLVRAFARLHGGEMTLASVLGEGTTVTVRMPILETMQPARPAVANDG